MYLYLLSFFSLIGLSINSISLFSLISFTFIFFSIACFNMWIFAIVWSNLVPIAPIIVMFKLSRSIAKSNAECVSVKSFSGINFFIFIFLFSYFFKILLSIESKSPTIYVGFVFILSSVSSPLSTAIIISYLLCFRCFFMKFLLIFPPSYN